MTSSIYIIVYKMVAKKNDRKITSLILSVIFSIIIIKFIESHPRNLFNYIPIMCPSNEN